MADNRTSISVGVKAAQDLHLELGIREKLEHGSAGRVDVFGAIAKLRATLMFQPLENLLGAYIAHERPGILITTKKTSPEQRGIAAHGLGHLYLNHRTSIEDDGVLQRSPFAAKSNIDRRENEADAFGSAFLAPRWLVAAMLQRHRWSPRDLVNSAFVYQGALRLGTTYRATCHAFARHRFINRAQWTKLLAVNPESIKRRLLNGLEPPDWSADVWLLTDRDEGMLIEGGTNDLFVVRLKEHRGAGYVWNFEQLKKAGFALVRDEQQNANPNETGSTSVRTVTAWSEAPVEARLLLTESRSGTDPNPLNKIQLFYALRPPERQGLYRP